MRRAGTRLDFLKPLLALVLWLALVGWATWQHASRAEQPPIYDAHTYQMKAQAFWANLGSGEIINPLNLEPRLRPPGTVLMSYPLGFDTDYRGFYFRSVFLPIVLVAAAVVVAGYSRDVGAAGRWYAVLIAAFLSTLPAFFHFQVSPHFAMVSYWGLVDNFLGGVAALAAAATVRMRGSWSLGWVSAAAALSSFCVLIKPSGLLVMALVDVTYLALAALRLRSQQHSPEQRKSMITWIRRSLLIFGALNALVVTASLASRYLSPNSLAFGRAAIEIMKAEIPIDWPVMLGVVHMGLGYPLLAWMLLSAVLVVSRWRLIAAECSRASRPMVAALALASIATFAFGAWFWIVGSGGGTQIRYFIPFALMAVIFAMPALARVAVAARPSAVIALVALCAFPVLNLGMLLVQGDPPIAWQQWTGVNLSSGPISDVGAQGRDLARSIKREGRKVVVYSMPMNVTDAEFDAALAYSRVADPPMPEVQVRRPVDWHRPHGFRVDEMLSADYWVFEPVRDPRLMEAAFAAPSIDLYAQETALFQAWATRLTPADGVAVVSETSTSCVLRITDRQRLESALNELLETRRWRPAFVAANSRRHWSEKEVVDALTRSHPALENVRFGQRIELRALSVSREREELILRIWWRPMAALKEHDWVFFAHSIDAHGNIRHAHHVKLDARDQTLHDGAFRSDTMRFDDLSQGASDRLAVGFVRPNETLAADNGARDWNGNRVIVVVP